MPADMPESYPYSPREPEFSDTDHELANSATFLIVDATVAALDRNLTARVFKIASGTETAALELVETVRRIAGSKSEFEFCPPITGDIPLSVVDISIARNELRFLARTPIDAGLSMTIRWLCPEAA